MCNIVRVNNAISNIYSKYRQRQVFAKLRILRIHLHQFLKSTCQILR